MEKSYLNGLSTCAFMISILLLLQAQACPNLEPVITTIEQGLVASTLGKFPAADLCTLRNAIAQIIG